MSDSSTTNRTASVLVVDDDPLIPQLVSAALSTIDYSVQSASTASQALIKWDRHRPDVLVLDHVLPDAEGLDLLAQFRERDATLPIIFVTARGNSQLTIDAMKGGAFDYLAKPLDLTALENQVRLAVEARRLMRVPVVVAPVSDEPPSESDSLIGGSGGMSEVYKSIGRAAARDMSVLLLGERGTGKALVARAIYQNSARSEAPFRTIKCTDYEPQRLEVELFGEEGDRSFIGRFEQCAGGTVLLEEVGETSPHLQSRLMRLLSTNQFERIGGREPLSANVRLFVSTSQDLDQLVAQGRFRSDLYYHLRSLAIQLPPLRERAADIPALVDYFVKRFSRLSRSYNAPTVRVSTEALHLLTNHLWPGNIDELQSVLRQTLIEHTGTVLASDSLQRRLHPSSSSHSPATDGVTNWQKFVSDRISSGESLYSDAIHEMERHLLALVMEHMQCNQAQSARVLGITRGNLRKKLRGLGMAPSATSDSAEDAAAENVSESTAIAEMWTQS